MAPTTSGAERRARALCDLIILHGHMGDKELMGAAGKDYAERHKDDAVECEDDAQSAQQKVKSAFAQKIGLSDKMLISKLEKDIGAVRAAAPATATAARVTVLSTLCQHRARLSEDVLRTVLRINGAGGRPGSCGVPRVRTVSLFVSTAQT